MIFFYQIIQRHAKNDDYGYIPTKTSYAVFLISAVGQSLANDYESNQQDATIQVNLLFLVSSTCFG